MESVAYNFGYFLGMGIGMFIIIGMIALYYLPTIIAFKNKNKNSLIIFILNTCGFMILPYLIAVYLLTKKYE